MTCENGAAQGRGPGSHLDVEIVVKVILSVLVPLLYVRNFLPISARPARPGAATCRSIPSLPCVASQPTCPDAAASRLDL